MTTTLTPAAPSGTLTRALPATAGLTAIALAVYQVATPGSPSASYDSAADWLREGLFLAYLVTTGATAYASYRRGLCPRAAAGLVAVGYGAIAVGVAAGMVMRDDPDWFFVLGGPGNLLAAAGFVTWAVWGRRRRVLPLSVALLCGVGGVVAVLFAEFGTSVLVAGFLLWLAFRDGTLSAGSARP